MKTIDGNSTHLHRWKRIGAHTLHAGHKPKGVKPYSDSRFPLREIRHVSVCTISGCSEIRVHIEHLMEFTHTPDQAVALAQQTRRIPGQTAVALVRNVRRSKE